MKFTKQRPTTGSFVAVWEYRDKVWSDTFLYINQGLKVWREGLDEEEGVGWAIAEWRPWKNHNCKYAVASKEK